MESNNKIKSNNSENTFPHGWIVAKSTKAANVNWIELDALHTKEKSSSKIFIIMMSSRNSIEGGVETNRQDVPDSYD